MKISRWVVAVTHFFTAATLVIGTGWLRPATAGAALSPGKDLTGSMEEQVAQASAVACATAVVSDTLIYA